VLNAALMVIGKIEDHQIVEIELKLGIHFNLSSEALITSILSNQHSIRIGESASCSIADTSWSSS
jgi:hypothetical protein